MEIQKSGGTKIIPNHALDTIRNPSEACLSLDLTKIAIP